LPVQELEEPLHVEVAVGGAEEREERAHRRDRLEAPAVAAAADVSLRAHLHVPDLAGDPRHAAVQAAPEDDPGADPGRRLHVDDVGVAAARAVGDLGPGAEVGVVVDLHG
jgi:hypothetical protein